MDVIRPIRTPVSTNVSRGRIASEEDADTQPKTQCYNRICTDKTRDIFANAEERTGKTLTFYYLINDMALSCKITHAPEH